MTETDADLWPDSMDLRIRFELDPCVVPRTRTNLVRWWRKEMLRKFGIRVIWMTPAGELPPVPEAKKKPPPQRGGAVVGETLTPPIL